LAGADSALARGTAPFGTAFSVSGELRQRVHQLGAQTSHELILAGACRALAPDTATIGRGATIRSVKSLTFGGVTSDSVNSSEASSNAVPSANVVPDRNAASAEDLVRFARSVGVAAADLPSVLPEDWRRLGLDGNYNFRDVGGYPGLAQRQIKRGLLWRSDHLNELTDSDLGIIDGLQLSAIYDFRLDLELARQPSRQSLTKSVPTKRLVVSDTTGSESAIEIIGDIMAGRRPAPPADFWNDNYKDMLNVGRHMFVGLLTGLAENSALPAMYHCTGGKDRTGIATILLHTLLGVDREVAINDFLFTNLYRTPYRIAALTEGLRANGVDVEAMIPVLGVTREAINVAINTIDHEYGGAEQYLVEGGLPADAPEKLRAALLE
jgi:protein-tyrosine phosphatase